MYDINTIDELVLELGGDTAVANRFGLTQPAVANWKIRGHITPGWHMRLYADALSHGKTVNPIVFDMTEDQFAPLAATRHRSSVRALAG